MIIVIWVQGEGTQAAGPFISETFAHNWATSMLNGFDWEVLTVWKP